MPALRIIARPALDGTTSSRATLLCAIGSLGALLAGCASQPYLNAHIESVNSEYRQLEDYVYALEEENARLQQQIDLLKQGVPAASVPANQTAPRGTAPKRPPIMTPQRPQPRASEQPSDLEPPVIELPGSTPPSTASPPRSTSQRPPLDVPQTSPADTPPSIEVPPLLEVPSSSKPDDAPPAPSDGRDVSRPRKPDPISPKPTPKKITHLFLNPALTGAADFDGQAGDDGLRVVLEPRSADDQFIPEAGPVSIVLLDPERQGEAARVARWDFDSSAMRQLLAASSSRGIKLEVPWPATAPTANRLKLFVRYETDDGRRLQADRDIFVNPPGQTLSRWTPRSTDRQPVTTASLSAPAQADDSSHRAAGTEWSPNR